MNTRLVRLPSPDQPNSGGADSKYFIGPLKAIFYFFFESATFPKIADYFTVKFYFSNACLNSVEHIYFPQQKIKVTDPWPQVSKRFVFC